MDRPEHIKIIKKSHEALLFYNTHAQYKENILTLALYIEHLFKYIEELEEKCKQ